MKNFLSAVVLCVLYNCANAQDYNVLLIPDSLKEHANVVKRFEETRIIIKDIDKAVIKHKYAVTILNEAGQRFSYYFNDYGNFVDLTDIDGNLYDAFGKKLKNVKKKDIGDFSLDDQMSLVTDKRIKEHSFFYNNYPYTVEYEDEQELHGIRALDPWIPQQSRNYAVQQSRYIIETPADYELKYKQFNFPSNPVVQNSGDKKIYTWEIKNLKAIAPEYFMPNWEEVTTSVFAAPVHFKIAGHEGMMDTWQNLGKFFYDLNNGRDVLPDNVKQDVHKLTDGLHDTREKSFALYNYLQKNTRYISVQLGIGGWQTFDANYVASKKYGDCKALSNYMKALLKEAGIKAYCVLVSGDETDTHGLWQDFPVPYFNHVILCVPDKDSIWFECTQQSFAAGYMGSFTGNRKALLIAEDGGHVVNTPVYTASSNRQIRNAEAVVDEKGNLNIDLKTIYTGVEQEDAHGLINDANDEDRKKYLNEMLDLPTYQIEKTNYTETKKIIPVVEEDLKISASNYASVSGKRLFLKPNLITKVQGKFSEEDKRKCDIEYPFSFEEIDTIHIKIPSGYTPEAFPKDMSIKNKFGNYSISFKPADSDITVYRSYTREAGRFPPSDYPEFTKFYNDMYKADRGQVVLVKKDN